MYSKSWSVDREEAEEGAGADDGPAVTGATSLPTISLVGCITLDGIA